MIGHIKKLSFYYNLIIYCNDAFLLKKLIPKNVVLININFKRKPNLLADFNTFCVLIFYLIKTKPNLTISISPKAGLITALSSFVAREIGRAHV